METINSSIWTEKYRPQTIEDVVAPTEVIQFLNKSKDKGVVSNLIFYGPFGTGKTTVALAICKELGADYLHINGSLDTSINDVRYKIETFATSKSLFNDGLKIVIMDECDRMSDQAQDSLKGLIELTSKKCRYIFISNHIERVNGGLLSRTQEFPFGVSENQKKMLIKGYFERIKHILDSEEISYDPKIVAKFCVSKYPDFRKTLGEIQKFADAYGEINEDIFNLQDESISIDLIEAMKSKQVGTIRKIVSIIDPATFYSTIYQDIKTHLAEKSIIPCIHTLGQFCHWHVTTINKEINLMDFCVTLMEEVEWK